VSVATQHGARDHERVMRRLIWAGLAVLLAGCGGGAHKATVTRTPVPTATAKAAPTTQPLRGMFVRCGTPKTRATAFRFRTRDGVTLDGAMVGSGQLGAVLIHEYPADLCGWWPYADYLAHHGVRALIVDLRCFGDSECPGPYGDGIADVAAAMRALRQRGARRVWLIGASMGGVISVTAGARLHPAGIVDLSGETSLAGLAPVKANALAAAPRLRVPALFVVAKQDQYVTPGEMRAIARHAPSPRKRVIVLPASYGHGWDMLLGNTSQWSPLAAQVASFIKG
jgi:pimeloyl-ACP methyl ester carboxylesterase